TPAWPCRGEVVLHLPATEVSGYVHDGLVEELTPDRCRLTLGSWSWPSLAALIGRFDADFEIVGPAELVEAFARLGKRYAEAVVRSSSSGAPGASGKTPVDAP
ncbi:transcriptional regulator, partial [Streptomyces albidoflavus]